VASLTAENAVTGNQVTQYVYGTTLADSGLATSILKRKEIYPDSVDADDVILFAYNRQRQVTTVTDQAGTVHAYDYDKLSRQTQDCVTTLGTGVDGAVRRIETAYEVRGMKARLTSFDNPTVGAGTVLNESTFVFNNYGQVTSEFQAHAGTVHVSTSPQVQYAYANGSANTIRPTGLTYPNGRVVTYDYATAGGVSDRSSRIAALKDGSTTLASYSYLGRQTFVEQDDTEPDVRWTLVDLSGSNDPETGDIYSGLDRFGRVKDNRWWNDGTSTDTDRIQYGYDRAGNRVWRKNPVADALGKRYDEVYGYDAAQRLKTMDRGTISGSNLTNPTFAQCWTLDPTGNWKGFREDADGNGTWDLVQARTANTVNEITDVTNTTGAAWIDPAYNRAGNMTTMPRPSDSTQSYAATYDAWNRLVKLAAGANTVSEYQYDGAKRRIVQKTYTGGTLGETRHFYYTEPSKWQVLEERVLAPGESPGAVDDKPPERQFVWGLRYIDDLIVRDRDTEADGTLDERLYALQDGNWNVTAVVTTAGAVSERYEYDPYGTLRVLTPTFGTRTTSNHAWETTYAGYRYNPATGLYHVRFRVLSPIVGWVQRDPLGYVDGSSLVAYLNNRPTFGADPTGLLIFFGGLPPWFHPILAPKPPVADPLLPRPLPAGYPGGGGWWTNPRSMPGTPGRGVPQMPSRTNPLLPHQGSTPYPVPNPNNPTQSPIPPSMPYYPPAPTSLPTPAPQPSTPQAPGSGGTRNRCPETCSANHPNLLTCTALSNGFNHHELPGTLDPNHGIYDDEVVDSFSEYYQLDPLDVTPEIGRWDRSRTCPGTPNAGWHANFYEQDEIGSPEYHVGSVQCCRCCEDTASGPNIRLLCRFRINPWYE
jgi:RHS repeat-associated protein